MIVRLGAVFPAVAAGAAIPIQSLFPYAIGQRLGVCEASLVILLAGCGSLSGRLARPGIWNGAHAG